MNEYSASTLALVRTYSLALWQSTPTPVSYTHLTLPTNREV